ncbi:MAG: 50S ribosomal protein L1 [Deltaproteobacteria bacterium GWC2_55_46]|nr:MAG: 50S ribosomal protein L1 [Deltaproteobacteria bacterium GWA2_55_82]OIJ74684.1 MAG: 50S ribosomal protein L1 [Deltaproteobacteria bacterium GWC2_55_46]
MGKKYEAAKAKIEANKTYDMEEGFRLVPETVCAKFDETVEVSGRLGVDPKHPEQMVRGTIVLPHGIGKTVRVLVFAKGEKEIEAKEAGADLIGAEDMIEKVSKGWLDFDAIVATPDMMGAVGKLGKVLGPRGLMPNPKLGTVTFDVKKAVSDLKAGKVEFRVDKAGNIHVPVGKASFGSLKLKENFLSLMEAIVKAKPSASKGTYLRSLFISTTMGPSIRLNSVEVRNLFK